MRMTSIQSSPLQTAPAPSSSAASRPLHKSRITPSREADLSPPTSSLQADVVQIKKGVLPTLKGTGAGALLAGGSSLAIFTVLTGGKPFAGSGGLVSGPVTLVAAVGGAVGGAVSANYAESKSQGAWIGGLAGAGAGAAAMALSGIQNDGFAGVVQGAITGALVGGITGAVGGVGGALVAQQK
jgi:hypothetical protein